MYRCLWLMGAVTLFFSACLVKENTSVPNPARVRLLNAIPEQTVSLLANETPFITHINFDQTSAYGYATPGFVDIKMVNITTNQIAKAKQNIQSDVNYSFFAIPDSSSTHEVNQKFKFSLVTDARLPLLHDSFYIRILHYTPDIDEPLFIRTFKEKGTSNTFDSIDNISYHFQRRTFNDISVNARYADFVKLPVGNYKFKLLSTRNEHLILAVDKQNFEENTYYTLYLRGFNKATDAQKAVVKIDAIKNIYP